MRGDARSAIRPMLCRVVPERNMAHEMARTRSVLVFAVVFTSVVRSSLQQGILRQLCYGQWRRLHGARRARAPTFTNGWARGHRE